MGVLYVVATPIGNLEDITIRAVKVLLSVPVVACEDTRHTGQLIKILNEKNNLNSNPKYISVRDWNESKTVNQVLNELANGDVALVSDAGTPLISDPGYKIVRAARLSGFKVSPIPGPSALTAALSVSGLPTDKFSFLGFRGKKTKLSEGMTNVLYENSHRLNKTLDWIRSRHSDSEIVIANELTKMHEIVTTDSTLVKKGEVTILAYLGKKRATDHGNRNGNIHEG